MNERRRIVLSTGRVAAAVVATGMGVGIKTKASSAAQEQTPQGKPAKDDSQLTKFSALPAGPLANGTGWRHQKVGKIKPNTATVLGETGNRFLRIVSENSASAWSHAVPAPIRRAHKLSWQWMVQGAPTRSALDSKSADDFAARLYVIFDYPLSKVPWGSRTAIRLARALYKDDVPAAAICYVWHPVAKIGTLVDSPYTSRVKMIVAGNGPAQGKWHREARDIGKDFTRAFGNEFGDGMAPLAAIAISADTDQTGGRVATSFSDVTLSR